MATRLVQKMDVFLINTGLPHVVLQKGRGSPQWPATRLVQKMEMFLIGLGGHIQCTSCTVRFCFLAECLWTPSVCVNCRPRPKTTVCLAQDLSFTVRRAAKCKGEEHRVFATSLTISRNRQQHCFKILGSFNLCPSGAVHRWSMVARLNVKRRHPNAVRSFVPFPGPVWGV